MKCLACQLHGRTIGFACAGCTRVIAALAHSGATLLPQHIVVNTPARSEGVLLDQWGRTHALAMTCQIGRLPRGFGIVILHSSVSRSHALITRTGSCWRIVDASSTNGTRVNGVRVTERILADGDRVRFGAVGFFALLHVTSADVGPEPAVPTSVQLVSSDRPRRRLMR